MSERAAAAAAAAVDEEEVIAEDAATAAAAEVALSSSITTSSSSSSSPSPSCSSPSNPKLSAFGCRFVVKVSSNVGAGCALDRFDSRMPSSRSFTGQALRSKLMAIDSISSPLLVGVDIVTDRCCTSNVARFIFSVIVRPTMSSLARCFPTAAAHVCITSRSRGQLPQSGNVRSCDTLFRPRPSVSSFSGASSFRSDSLMPSAQFSNHSDVRSLNTARICPRCVKMSFTVSTPSSRSILSVTRPTPGIFRALSGPRNATMSARAKGTKNWPFGLLTSLAILASRRFAAMPADTVRPPVATLTRSRRADTVEQIALTTSGVMGTRSDDEDDDDDDVSSTESTPVLSK